MVTRRNSHTHTLSENESQEIGLSADEVHQRAISLRVQSMGLENENLAANTKEQYLTYLKLF